MQRASVEVARTTLLAILDESPAVVQVEVAKANVVGAKEALHLARVSRRLGRQVGGILREARSLRNNKATLGLEPTSEHIEQMSWALDEMAKRLQTAQAEERRTGEFLDALEAASHQWERLAAAAIPLLTKQCPVCGQSIDPDDVREHLRRMTTDMSRMVECRESVEVAKSKVKEAATGKRALESELAQEKATLKQWEQLREREDALDDQLKAIANDMSGPVRLSGFTFSEIEQTGPEIVAFLDELSSVLERYADVIAESQATGELDRVRSELVSAQALLQDRRKHSNQATSRASRLKQLAQASTRARVEVTNRRFAAIEPLVTDIYSRLDPHPAFKTIEFTHDTYYGKGIMSPVVSDDAAEVKGDPLIVFSTSQANIVALSCFLAMSLGTGERGLPFVLLDDPVQSMDDINVLGFADLCRFLRAERQLVVSTHDRRLANLLRRKLAPRDARDRTITHRFLGWDRRGPSVETELLQYDARDAELRLLSRPA